jgi:hypothetical protein
MTAAAEASHTGAPMMRQLALGFPGDPAAWTTADEYLLGASLLVAPVVTAGVTSRQVYLPAGAWVRLFGPAVHATGPTTIAVDAPTTELPVFAAAGTIVPLLPDGVDTVVAAAAPLVDLAAVGDAREVEVVLGADGQLGEPGGLDYSLHSASASLSASATLRWNGASLSACVAPAAAPCATIDPAAQTATAYVTGAGTLDSDDGTTRFTIAGGSPARASTVRLRW